MIYSYTSFNCYENCPKQFYYRYVARSLPFQETEPMRWGNRVHKALAHRLQTKEPLPPTLEQFEPLCAALEQASGPTLIEHTLLTDRARKTAQKASAYMTARPDFVTFNDAYTYAFIVDWKTGKPREDDTELCFQTIALRAHYPSVQAVDAAYYWTRERRMGPVHDVLAHVDDVWDRLGKTVDLIAKQTAGGEEAFPAKPGKHFPCPWCTATFCPFREDA